MDRFYTQILILALYALTTSYAYPYGPPTSACSSMQPSHGANAQSSAAPFTITVSSSCYNAGDTLDVVITPTDGNSFKGFFVQARMRSSSAQYGVFSTNDIEQKLLRCPAGQDSAISHSVSTPKMSTKLKWSPGPDLLTDITFTATIVRQKTTFWTNVKSSVIPLCAAATDTPSLNTADTSPNDNTTTTTPTTTTTTTNKSVSGSSIVSPCLYFILLSFMLAVFKFNI